MPKSLAMAIPANRQKVCNDLMEAMGRGPKTFSVALNLGAVLAGYGAHTWDDELATALEIQTVIRGSNLAAFGFTANSAKTALGYIRHRILTEGNPFENFTARLAADGLTLATPSLP